MPKKIGETYDFVSSEAQSDPFINSSDFAVAGNVELAEDLNDLDKKSADNGARVKYMLGFILSLTAVFGAGYGAYAAIAASSALLGYIVGPLCIGLAIAAAAALFVCIFKTFKPRSDKIKKHQENIINTSIEIMDDKLNKMRDYNRSHTRKTLATSKEIDNIQNSIKIHGARNELMDVAEENLDKKINFNDKLVEYNKKRKSINYGKLQTSLKSIDNMALATKK